MAGWGQDRGAASAARRIAAFTDELIRAAVHTGAFSDPMAEQHLADVLIKRRDTILRIYLTAINPIVAPRRITVPDHEHSRHFVYHALAR